MANKEHLQRLITAIASMSMAPWNHWRIEHPDVLPDLLAVELPDVNLSFADLSHADLSHADLSRTNLYHATLQRTDLTATCLAKADLSEADLSRSILKDADLRGAILRHAKLRGVNLLGASLGEADLRGADLTDALIEPEVIEQQKKRFGLGVSQLEKVALRLFARTRGKDHIGAARGTEIPRPRRRS